MDDAVWKNCNVCKHPIGFNAVYYVCSVSTCRQKGTGFIFCSVTCWSSHLGLFNHRSAGAEEMTSPAK